MGRIIGWKTEIRNSHARFAQRKKSRDVEKARALLRRRRSVVADQPVEHQELDIPVHLADRTQAQEAWARGWAHPSLRARPLRQARRDVGEGARTGGLP